MNNGDLFLYVEELEKSASIGKAFKGVWGAAKNVKGSFSSSMQASKVPTKSLKSRISTAAGSAKETAKKEWKGMSRGAKAATIGTGVAGLAAGGYAAKKMLD